MHKFHVAHSEHPQGPAVFRGKHPVQGALLVMAMLGGFLGTQTLKLAATIQTLAVNQAILPHGTTARFQ